MNKNYKIGFALVVVVIMYIFTTSYNSLVIGEERVSEAFSQIESNIQRKVDLLPNLVKVVKSYAKHETELFSKITELRASSSKGTNTVKDIQKLNNNINLSTLKLFAVAENYPNLRSSEQFLQLQSQIEGAENRINIMRMQYNSEVKDYTSKMRTFPENIVALSMGFQSKEYFQAEPVAHKKIALDL